MEMSGLKAVRGSEKFNDIQRQKIAGFKAGTGSGMNKVKIHDDIMQIIILEIRKHAQITAFIQLIHDYCTNRYWKYLNILATWLKHLFRHSMIGLISLYGLRYSMDRVFILCC